MLQRSGTCLCHSMKSKSGWANIANVGQSYFCKCLRVKDGTCGVFFQFREVSWEGAAACRSSYLFLASDIKAHPWQCQRPHGADPAAAAAVSVDVLAGIMDMLL